MMMVLMLPVLKHWHGVFDAWVMLSSLRRNARNPASRTG
jgi:hypothetical protein